MVTAYSERRADFWHGHLQRWRESGLSKGRYCRVHGLSPNRFGYWAKKYPPEGPAEVALPAIVPLSFTLAPKAPSIGLPLPIHNADQNSIHHANVRGPEYYRKEASC